MLPLSALFFFSLDADDAAAPTCTCACNYQAYLRLSYRAQALDVLLPLIQDKAEQGEGGPPAGLVPQMSDEDHELLDHLEKRRVKLKRRISDMANRSFGSIFRYDGM